MKKYFSFFVALLAFVIFPLSFANAAGEIGAYCAVPSGAVPHGSTVPLTIKFSDSDKSNDFIAQGPFKVLRYDKNGKAIIVEFKRGNEKDTAGKENTDKPTLAFSVTLSPKHKLPAPATEEVTFTYFVSHKEGKRGSLSTANRESQVDCSFTVQHEIEKGTTPSGGTPSIEGDPDFDLLRIQSIGTLPSSPWYFLKEWKRGISRLFTFDATAKAELELKIMNEKMTEVLAVAETKPDDEAVLVKAFANYTDAAGRLETRLGKLKENSENPNVETLLKKLDEQTLKHSLLLNQIAERWESDPYAEDASVVNPRAARDNHLQGAVDVMQKKIQGIAVAGAEKDAYIKEKAEAQIKRAEAVVKELESALTEFSKNDVGVSAKHAIKTKGTGAQAGKSAQLLQSNCKKDEPEPPVECAEGLQLFCVLDNAGKPKWDCVSSARISTNMAIERQTPKTDFGDRMKAGLETAGGMLANGKTAFVEGKFGEAFGLARSAEVIATSRLRLFVDKNADGAMHPDEFKIAPVAPPMPNVSMPIIPEKGKVPVVEKRVFPETNNKEATCGKIQCFRYEPVCGTDGKTYSCGEADASSCGVKVAYAGECKTAPTAVKPNGCMRESKLCNDGSAVPWTGPNCDIAVCPTTPPAGEVPEQGACEQLYNPICGTNGKTYGNDCVAKAAGVAVSYKGECASASVEVNTATTEQSGSARIAY